MNKAKYVITFIVVLAIAAGAIVLTQGKDKEPASNTAKTDTAQESKTESSPAETAAPQRGSTVAISYTDNGFSPAQVTVKSGTTVTIKNESSGALQFDSDPHPQHTDNEELNVNNVPPGDSETFVANRKGTFGYHNHLNASDTGTIIVE